ncbi:TetR/AcrR family transcriptional regulator [Corynebacterium oculi]|uniref:HTH-type transcriptional regulator BetI n=1 Tax=Corynebacterium oculi TaxID=1544416 RepID=A0A0Q0TXY3_9CORY|nr:TetR family transcriptional regulator C-terminal domain-containing protein [Corynebacterium oculi]KQB83925.1 HTH-type transcriptional regulator BetI [Corynebacterium oculi]
MPARINAEERRRLVIEAAFRQVVAEGVEGITLRKVAAEADLNIGSVRHFFDGHEELLAAAVREAGDRMGHRLALHPMDRLRGLRGEEAVNAMQALVEQVLPVDDVRHAEAIVVVEFIRASRVNPVFAPVAAEMYRDLVVVLEEAFTELGVVEPRAAAGEVSALIGGLTLDAVTPHGSLTSAQVRATLRRALNRILNE